MSEPRTPAGRALAATGLVGEMVYHVTLEPIILAIEAEAATLDVERLARALEASGVSYEQPPEQDAVKVAAEYARLSTDPEPPA